MKKFRMRNVNIVWRKELLDIIRDKRTLISMIVVPILLMPVLMLGVGAITALSIQEMEEQEYHVALVGTDIDPDFMDILNNLDKTNLIPMDTNEEAAITMLESGDIQGIVIFPQENRIEEGSRETVRILVREDKETSAIAMKRVVKKFEAYQETITAQMLKEINAPEFILEPFVISEENIATDEEMAAYVLAGFLPYMLILMALSGAMYPAIDLTAGEKERGTLETLLASPASRLEIVLGKFLTVMLTSMVSAILSLTSLVGGLVIGVPILSAQFGADINISFDMTNILVSLLMLIPLSALFAALLITICSFAKSVREAQTYVQPLVFLVILPAMMSMMPGSEPSVQDAWLPVVNVSLVLKDILTGTLNPVTLGNTLLSTAIYAMLAIGLTVKVFQRENVLFRV